MATRKAGDSLLKQAYLAELAKRGVEPGALGADGVALQEMLAQHGSVALGGSDLRELLLGAASQRKTAEMGTAEKLGVIERYLQDSYSDAAPVLLPVQDRAGVYGASVIDGDRMIVHGLSRAAETPFGDGGDLSFAPAAVPGLVHVVEAAPVLSAPGVDPIATYANAMSADTARKLYAAAQSEGFTRADGALEDWSMGADVGAQSGPVVQRLFQQLQQKQPTTARPQGRPPFEIVPSRGAGAYYDVYGMREGIRNMGNARLPGEPGWLGNPYVADDAGGRYTRQQATDMFGQLIEQKAQDPAWRDAFLALQGKRIGYYKPDEQAIHLHALQDWITRNAGG
jgi:hypothetical protein